jgi:hypothetical protein
MCRRIEIVGDVHHVEIVAVAHGIRELENLRKRFGSARWRKLKGEARVRLPSGRVRWCEVHWHQAHGIGKRKLKIKRFLD